ncbi:MAG: molybdenum cofactor biosynthesis protein MoaE [Syntrophaceae bacterium]
MEKPMDINALIRAMKARPDFAKVGMVLCHNGVVRGTSRNGRAVSGVRVTADYAELEKILAEQRARPGIVDIQVRVNEGELEVGDDLLLIAVAGDIREHVIPVLTDTLNAVKARVTRKTEHGID